MKLHLPKALLSAVLAACMVNTTAWATSDNTDHSGWDKITDNESNTATDSYGIGDKEISSIDTSDSTSNADTLFIRSNNGVKAATVTSFTIGEGKIAKIQGWWTGDDGHPQFELLTISTLTFGNNSVLNVAAGNTVKVDAYTGTFKGTVDGTLTIEGVANLTNASISTSSNNTGAGSLIITGNPESNRDTGASVIGGTATISCTSSEIRGTLGIRGNGTLKYTGGTHSVTKLDIHNQNGYDGTDELIVSGATVNVTGTDDSNNMNNNSSGPAAVTVGHWNNGTGKISVGGESAGKSVFNVFEGTIRMSYNASSNLTIGKNGIVNAMGIQYSNFHDGYGTDTAVINLQGGRLNLGSGGLSANTSKTNVTLTRELNLQSGTLGALASEISISAGDVNLSGAVTIDTAILNRDGEATGGKATINFNQAITAQESAALTIQGGGAVNLSTINMSHTMVLNVLNDTSLSIGSVVVDELNHQLTDISPEGAANAYFTNDGTTHTTSGFKVEDKTYLLFDGYVWDGTVSGFTVGSQDGDTTLSTSGVGSIYYVNEGEHTISTAGNYINGTATRYIVEQGATLIIDSAQKTIVDGNETVVLSAAQLLTSAIGGGDITLKSNVSLEAGATSQVNGMLTIQDCKLTMDNGRGSKYDLTSFDAVTLDNGSVRLRGDEIQLDNVTVTSRGGLIECHDIESLDRPYKLTGTTTLEGTLKIETTSWRHVTNIEKLVGSTGAKLVVKDNLLDSQKDGAHNKAVVNIGNITGYSGAIEVIRDHEAVTEINATTNGETTLSSVLLKNGGAFTMLNSAASLQTTIASLVIEGAGTLGTTRSSSCYQGTIDVERLSHTGTSAVLTLMNGSQCDETTTINLNGGSLKGTINVESNAVAEPTQNCKLQVNINASDLAKDAVINFRDPSTGNTTGNEDLLVNNKQGNYNILGVGADTVKVGGLTGTTTNAATIKSTGDSGTRTLEINTTQSADYSTNAKVEASVNLVKSGEGTQTLTGTVASSSVSVLGGGLSLTGIETLRLQDLVVKSGATLSVGNGVATANASTSAAATSVSKSASLQGGATINGGLDLSAATSLTLDGVGSNAVKIGGDLVLPESGTPLTLRGDVLNSIASLRAGEQLEIFDVKGGFFVGGTQYSEALTASNGIILDTIFSSEDINPENYYLGFYNIPDEAGYSTVYIGMIVPEPTTATLSLLALAALAARRRRRATR